MQRMGGCIHLAAKDDDHELGGVHGRLGATTHRARVTRTEPALADSELPQCIGQPGCSAAITGELPTDFVPPLTMKFPLVQTFRIVEPSNYARTVFIEALEAAGVTVNADPVAPNRVDLLPHGQSDPQDKPIAGLAGLPFLMQKVVLKVS
jgi:hypothetical protein